MGQQGCGPGRYFARYRRARRTAGGEDCQPKYPNSRRGLGDQPFPHPVTAFANGCWHAAATRTLRWAGLPAVDGIRQGRHDVTSGCLGTLTLLRSSRPAAVARRPSRGRPTAASTPRLKRRAQQHRRRHQHTQRRHPPMGSLQTGPCLDTANVMPARQSVHHKATLQPVLPR